MSAESFADLGVSRAVISTLSAAGIIEPFAIHGNKSQRRSRRRRPSPRRSPTRG